MIRAVFVLWQSGKCVSVRLQNIVSSTTVQSVAEWSVTRMDQGCKCVSVKPRNIALSASVQGVIVWSVTRRDQGRVCSLAI